jgi:hypothetical protein
LSPALPLKLIESRIEHAFANRIEENFTAGQDDAAALLPEGPFLVRIGPISIDHSIRKILQHPRRILARLANHLLQILAVIGAESILVTVFASAMTQPGHDEIDRFHGASTS